MKHLSIRLKITLWFMPALLIVAVFTYLVVLSISNRILQKTIRDNLIRTVEDNVDKIDFYNSIEGVHTDDDDVYINYVDGFLEINDDFLNQANQVYTALYSSDAALIYGENPIFMETTQLGFADSMIQKVKANGTLYYVFDKKLTSEGLDDLWLRGVVSETQGAVQISDITHFSLVFLPLVMLLALFGGYLTAGRTLRPIKQISETAAHIGKGDDLKQRIEIGDGDDELHQLADSFNRMFKRLEDSFDAERQFTSDASHELRTPMTVITSQCEYSLQEPRSPEEYEKALRVIQRQSRKMSKLINTMLDFTRLEMRSEIYVLEPVDLTELVTSICSDMALIQENGITLEYEAEEGIHFRGNRDLLSRLLTNLISNAYRYGNTDGHIFVRLRRQGDHITLSVADDGIGILEEDLPKIFQRFYQTDGSHSSAGMGLGLSMVDKIAQFHGGKIHVESQPGKGSTFTLIL